MRITDARVTVRQREHGEVARIARLRLVPCDGRRDTRIRQRPHGIGGRRSAVLCILVVVEKDAVPFLLPPFRTRECRYPPLYFACKRQCGAAHLSELPQRVYA